MAQLLQLTQGAQGGNPGLTVVIQGQGQTQGQLQILPQGVTVVPSPGQQLMQAAMPNGQVQRFLFTPVTPIILPLLTHYHPSNAASKPNQSPRTSPNHPLVPDTNKNGRSSSCPDTNAEFGSHAEQNGVSDIPHPLPSPTLFPPQQ
ncbi:hypothetical protein CgunFtcFv8_009032 [Champsocephalus gunnari]|uniref:Uncharacterized protein n=1 Tax=Champsocephalus gunnari TaxID=52237 RepID=A0AAN8HGL2_CHAGU|nr:hypothetical protein CgunFtcFv8_009032 [Champsocephalus gunnari]